MLSEVTTSIEPCYRIIIVDDDSAVRESSSQLLEAYGWQVRTLSRARRVDELLLGFPADVVLTDVRMPGTSGLDLLEQLQRNPASPPVVLLTAYGDVPTALQAMRCGAFEFIEKPYDASQLIALLEQAAELHRTRLGERRLKQRLATLTGFERIFIGEGSEAQFLRDKVLSLLDVSAPIMLRGETGSGKKLVARAMHDLGSSPDQPFLELDCAQLVPDKTVELLCGIEGEKIGLLERVGRGTIFLRGIAGSAPDIQSKFLQISSSSKFRPIGAIETKRFLGRFISSINTDLEATAEKRDFRVDLFYRLSEIVIEVPPLRNRLDDILLIFSFFLEKFANSYGETLPLVGTEETAVLMSHDWPGNVRELRSVAERWILQRRVNRASPLRQALEGKVHLSSVRRTLREATAVFEAELITRAIILQNGQMDNVAEYLGIPRRTLNDKMLKLNIGKESILKDEMKRSLVSKGDSSRNRLIH